MTDAEKLKELQDKVKSLFKAVAHGDTEHRLWLKMKIADHFNLDTKDFK